MVAIIDSTVNICHAKAQYSGTSTGCEPSTTTAAEPRVVSDLSPRGELYRKNRFAEWLLCGLGFGGQSKKSGKIYTHFFVDILRRERRPVGGRQCGTRGVFCVRVRPISSLARAF